MELDVLSGQAVANSILNSIRVHLAVCHLHSVCCIRASGAIFSIPIMLCARYQGLLQWDTMARHFRPCHKRNKTFKCCGVEF